ncbi:MAG: 4-hydroxy-tetrahydrodipicolinate synthase [Desulfobacterales bacterium]|nr:4-hydroxy-tetrahydrodipicolinate synthase [Desulfobacterales bacterium]
MITGSFTALITPFKENTVDYEGLGRLTDFQIENGISGILAVGTTGESPTLAWDEHNSVIENVVLKSRNKCICIAGAGSNNTIESIEATQHAVDVGADAVLLVDPYYNGPSSLEIRREYIEPIAKSFPGIQLIPYIIPGRTGAQMLPEDLAILKEKFDNVNTVKEATGNIDNMKRTRECCGPDYSILSGDDPMTFQMMADPEIKASGVISVASNIAPKAVADIVHLLQGGNQAEAKSIIDAVEPLFQLVTVKTTEKTPYGEVVCKARNPLAIKTLMAILGMPAGPCRKPLGKMTKNGLDKVLETARSIQVSHPQVFKPAADFFNIDIEDRLNNPVHWEGLYYEDY